MIRGVLYDMWSVVRYVGCYLICGLLFDMWAFI